MTEPSAEIDRPDYRRNYVVELMGRVHLGCCPTIPNPRMTWNWEGVNAMPNDEACGACLPDGLPSKTPGGQ